MPGLETLRVADPTWFARAIDLQCFDPDVAPINLKKVVPSLQPLAVATGHAHPSLYIRPPTAPKMLPAPVPQEGGEGRCTRGALQKRTLELEQQQTPIGSRRTSRRLTLGPALPHLHLP